MNEELTVKKTSAVDCQSTSFNSANQKQPKPASFIDLANHRVFSLFTRITTAASLIMADD
jgi:predicted component of type VI protein secretion system